MIRYNLRIAMGGKTIAGLYDNLEVAKKKGREEVKKIERTHGIGMAAAYIDVLNDYKLLMELKLFLYNSGRHYWRRNK